MTVRRWVPLVLLIALAAGGLALRLDRYLSLDALRDNHAALGLFVAEHSVIAPLAYIAVYAIAVAVSFPGASILTLAGGFLFGVGLGGTLTVIAATLGATLLFLGARSALGDLLRRKAGPFVAQMAEGFARDAFNYLLFLRLVPAFPFWAVNLVPALTGMRLAPYVVATALGIIPGTFVFTAFGASLGHIFEEGRTVSLAGVLSPTLIAGLIGLALLSLLPVLARHLRQRNGPPPASAAPPGTSPPGPHA